jgi:hypothetical protein
VSNATILPSFNILQTEEHMIPLALR